MTEARVMRRCSWITPDWPAPPRVRALSTTRDGGVSRPPYESLNLSDGVGDSPEAVHANCDRLLVEAGLPRVPVWLRQVHGTGVVYAGEVDAVPEADAVWTDAPGFACAVLTADCLPVLLCDRSGTSVAAVHAGWRGLAAGVIERTIDAMHIDGADLLAWLGPAIGPGAFEVGAEVREAFLRTDPGATEAFSEGREGHWMADLYRLARRRLNGRGVRDICGGGFCTYGDAEQFYSYRRDGVTGRMATLIWLEVG